MGTLLLLLLLLVVVVLVVVLFLLLLLLLLCEDVTATLPLSNGSGSCDDCLCVYSLAMPRKHIIAPRVIGYH